MELWKPERMPRPVVMAWWNTDGVVVKMDEKTAGVLMAILRSVGGSPYNSYRGNTDAVSEALFEVGVDTVGRDRIEQTRRSIYFEDGV